MFFKKRKLKKLAADRIGKELHRQIISAFERNEKETGVRLTTAFTSGYIYGIIRMGFANQRIKLGDGMEGEKYIKSVCNGVLPNRLYESIHRNLSAIEHENKIGKKGIMEMFEKGLEVGASDSRYFSVFLGDDDEELNDIFEHLAGMNEPNNLYSYLIGEEENIKYAPLE